MLHDVVRRAAVGRVCEDCITCDHDAGQLRRVAAVVLHPRVPRRNDESVLDGQLIPALPPFPLYVFLEAHVRPAVDLSSLQATQPLPHYVAHGEQLLVLHLFGRLHLLVFVLWLPLPCSRPAEPLV
ncbi:MAG: hypothetical protein IH881_09210, partial [Myxococcales bacterium]|nr:hypothetical protein [Myxococcales bacterium]